MGGVVPDTSLPLPDTAGALLLDDPVNRLGLISGEKKTETLYRGFIHVVKWDRKLNYLLVVESDLTLSSPVVSSGYT